MERKERLDWIKLSSKVNDNPNGKYFCVRNLSHIIKQEVIDFDKYNKREIHLICEQCNIQLTFTLDKPKL